MIKALINNIKEHKLKYVIIFVLVVAEYVLTIFQPRIVQYLIDIISKNELTQSILIQQLLIIALIAVAMYVSVSTYMTLLYNDAYYYHYNLRNKLYKKIINMRIPYYEKFKSGDMLTRFSSDTTAVVDFIGYGLNSFVTGVGTILFLLPAMFFISWQLSILAIIPIVISGYFIYKISFNLDDLVKNYRTATSNLSSEVLEIVEGIRVSRAYGNSQLGQKRFEEKTKQMKKDANNITKQSAWYGRIAFLGISISTLLIISVGGLMLSQQKITLGEIVALQLYTELLLDPMWMLSDLVNMFKSSNVSFENVIDLLNQTDNMQEDGSVELHSFNNLTFDNYSFQYALSQQQNLKNISVTLQRGQTLGVIGKTGSGKTTFIKQLLLQYPVGQGVFEMNGLPITQYKRSSVEQLIGYVPQEHLLFSKSIKENLLIGKKDADILEIASSIQTASFTKDLELMRDGIDTIIGEKGVSISGGQKQRISIARAFIKRPEILILDDSLSAVDAKTEAQIIENIKTMQQDQTTIIVSHRLSAVNHADWIIVFDAGKIIEEGTPEQLYANHGWYYEQYHNQNMGGDVYDISY